MPCEILITTEYNADGSVNYTHSDPEKDRSEVMKKGYIQNIIDSPRSFRGFFEGLPYFCAINVTDAISSDINSYINTLSGGGELLQSWRRLVDFETVSNNPSLDTWRIRVFANNPGLSNFAGITREMVETYLTRWNATVFSAVTNEVQFDVVVYEALQSIGFWGVAPIGIIFNETDYNSSTGIHTIEVNYFSSAYAPDKVEKRVVERGGSILSHNTGTKIISFSINRSSVFNWFQGEVKKRLKKTIYPRQFRVSGAMVDNIVSNGTPYFVDHYHDDEQTQFRGQVEYRVLNATFSQVQTYIINRLDEAL